MLRHYSVIIQRMARKLDKKSRNYTVDSWKFDS